MNDLYSIFGAEPAEGLDHLSKTFELQQAINCSVKDKAGYSILVPEIKWQVVPSLAEPEKIASLSLLVALSAIPSSERVVGTIPNHPAATIPWQTLQHTLSQATYLQYDRNSPSAPQSWEAVDRAAHWFKRGDTHGAPDSNVILQLLLQIASAENEVAIEPLLRLLGLRNRDCDVSNGVPTQTPRDISPETLTALSDYNESPKERAILELRILKFPDLNDSRFSISRLRLMVWVHNNKHPILPRVVTDTGITIEHFTSHYSARLELISRFDEKTRSSALQQLDALLATRPEPHNPTTFSPAATPPLNGIPDSRVADAPVSIFGKLISRLCPFK